MKLYNHVTLELNPAFAHLQDFMLTLPERCKEHKAKLIYSGRNRIWLIEEGKHELVVKEFGIPHILNRHVYGVMRPSKAKRSYHNALQLQSIGVGTPTPVGYLNVRKGLLFDRSYYVCLRSECQHPYLDILNDTHPDDVLAAIARQTALMHNNGLYHKDYGRGNMLYSRRPDGSVRIDVIDLNRIWRGHIDIRHGCKNFDRLPAHPEMQRTFAKVYAAERGFDAEECYSLIRHYRTLSLGSENF